MPLPLLRSRPSGGLLLGPLPTGCALCEKGRKLVLFATGVCHYRCYYCPVSFERRMSPYAWANERRFDPSDLEALAEEAVAMGASGTGITGGDPMYDPERTIRFIRFLKSRFGPRHHIHLYTQIPFDPSLLDRLAQAGLDEIRFHPPEEIWGDVEGAHSGTYSRLYRKALRIQSEGRWVVGFEVPALPGSLEELTLLVLWAKENGVSFVNLNELEFSESNSSALLERAFRLRSDENMSVEGSREVAQSLLERFRSPPPALHFCSSPFKDAVQLRERLLRRARSVALPHEVPTRDGTLLRGVVECPNPREVASKLVQEWGVPPHLVFVRKPPTSRGPSIEEPQEGTTTTGRGVHLPRRAPGESPPFVERLEVAPWILERIAHKIPYPSYISEVLPTFDEIEVERTPLSTQGL